MDSAVDMIRRCAERQDGQTVYITEPPSARLTAIVMDDAHWIANRPQESLPEEVTT